MTLLAMAKAGAIASAAGVALLVTFVGVLLIFPVARECDSGKCTYVSSAPSSLQPIVTPVFLAISLLIIAAGILVIRYSRWRESKAPA
jgi:Zn-dependent protease with chaperone function